MLKHRPSNGVDPDYLDVLLLHRTIAIADKHTNKTTAPMVPPITLPLGPLEYSVIAVND